MKDFFRRGVGDQPVPVLNPEISHSEPFLSGQSGSNSRRVADSITQYVFFSVHRDYNYRSDKPVLLLTTQSTSVL